MPVVRAQQEWSELNGLPRARGKFFKNEYLRRGKVPRQQRPAYVGMRERITKAKAERIKPGGTAGKNIVPVPAVI